MSNFGSLDRFQRAFSSCFMIFVVLLLLFCVCVFFDEELSFSSQALRHQTLSFSPLSYFISTLALSFFFPPFFFVPSLLVDLSYWSIHFGPICADWFCHVFDFI
mmetsp:Transcript_26175/g.66513  ORF Transcript_26175/g.66513 Transcript_26175/m.66513 type:complete len:104 (+) Transcript_26175:1619-1930(+)